MRNYLIVVLLNCELSFGAISQDDRGQVEGIPIQHHFTTKDYHGGIQNWDLALGSQGLIYSANNYGLLEFDGTKWQTHPIEGNTRLICLNTLEENRIYVGGQNLIGFFERDFKGILQYHSLLGLLPDSIKTVDIVWNIVKHKDKFFFNTDEYTYMYDGNSLMAIPFAIDGGYLFSVKDSLISYSRSEGLLGWNGQRFIKTQLGGFFKEKSVMSIVPTQNGDFQLFLSNGEIHLSNHNTIRPWNLEISEFLKKALVNTAILLTNGNLAIGTQNNGIVIINESGQLINHFSHGKGLNGRSVHGILEDKFQNLWIGQNNGISYLEMGAPFRLINETLGLWGTGYAAASNKNKLYLGTTNGLFVNNRSKGLSDSNDQFSMIPGTEGQVWSVATHMDKLLMGHHRGAFIIEEATASPIFDENGVWRFREIPNSNQLIGGWYNGFLTLNPSTRQIRRYSGFNESSRIFEFIDDSTLWMTHGYKGAYKLRISKEGLLSSFYGDTKGFPSNILINVFKLGDELVFPAEYGIYQFNKEQDLFTPSEQLENLLGKDTHVSVLEMTQSGDIYYIADKKLGLLKRIAFNTYNDIHTPFNRVNKYLSDDLENITYIDEQNVLIGAKEGFVSYNPLIRKDNTLETTDFKTFIRNIRYTNGEDSLIALGHLGSLYDLGALAYPLTSIHFEYSAPYYDGFNDLVYQYKLDNFDQEWSSWTKTTFKEYTNLPTGKYVFKVRSKNIYEAVSTESEIHFAVLAPWYLTIYAYYGYAIVLATLFALTLYSQEKKHKHDKRKMEINQQREIHQKNKELADVSESSKATINALKEEKLQTEIQFKSKELTSSAMHLLNKNQFMMGVKSKLDMLVKNNDITKDEIKRIIKNIDKNVEEDKDWEQFTSHFDQVHEDFLTKLKTEFPDITPQEIKLAAYLRMNMSSKEIAQLLNISVRGVEIGRYRLRKKLNLDREINLVTFMMEL